MSSEHDDRDDSTTGKDEGADASGESAHVEGTHGGLAIGRTTGMGAGITKGGTPGAGESSGGEIETGGGDESGGGSETVEG